MVFVVIYILLWIPWVQTQIGHVFAYSMSKALDTKVTIDRVEITPLSNFKFHNFFIQDYEKDTLIYAKYAEAQSFNVFSLFQKTIDIGHVVVKDAIFKVQRLPKAEFFNIHFLIAFFEGPNDGRPRPEKFKLQMGGADLVRARIHLSDAAIGTSALVTCDTGYVHGHASMGVDMIGKLVWADKAHLTGTDIKVNIFDIVEIPGIDPDFEFPVDSTIPYWNVGCEKLLLNDVRFSLRNDRIGLDSSRMLDFSNLDIDNINLDVDSFRLHEEIFTGIVRDFHGIDHGGFELKSLHGNALISPKKVALTNFKLETNTSTLGHAVSLKYKRYMDFYEFPDKVKILATFDSTTSITFRDIAAFAPSIKQNLFIESNLDHPIDIQGKFKGTINNFRARDLDVRLLNRSFIKGHISLNDISVPDAAFMDLNLKKVSTDYDELKLILPFVNLPPNLSTLGEIIFKGSYTGFFQDFVAYGQLDTDLGNIQSDLQLNLRKGKETASYRGGLEFDNFDIGRFLDKRDVGRITINSKIRGTGLTMETLNAELENAKIDSFDFKQYKYKNILIDGLFKQKQFDGDIVSKDSNMCVFVRGIVDLNGDIPSVDIRGNVENINFKNLNISKEQVGLHLDTFDIKAKGNNLDNFSGSIAIRGVNGYRGNIYSKLDSIIVKADNIISQDSSIRDTRVINLKSDVVEVSVWGRYDVVNLVRSLKNFFKVNHPNLFKELNNLNEIEEIWEDSSLVEIALNTGIKSIDSIPHQEFDIRIDLKDSKNLTQILNKNFKSLKDIELTGHYFGSDDYLELQGNIGGVDIGDLSFEDVFLKGKANGPSFLVQSSLGALNIKGKSFIPNVIVNLDAIGDSVLFIAKADAVGEVASMLSIRGKLEIKENLVVLKLDTSELNILNQKWVINDKNYIKVGDKVLDIKNVELVSGKKRIKLSSINNNLGAKINLQNMNLGWLYGMMKPLPKIEIDGLFSGEATMQNVFNQKEIHANILLDSLFINDDYWGSNSVLEVKADSLKSIFTGVFTHSSNFVDSLIVNSSFIPKFSTKEKFLQNLLDINVDVDGAKAKIVEYFLKEQITETEGLVNAQARIYGNLEGKKTVMNIDGDGMMKGVKTKVIFLQTKYVLSDGKVKIDNKGFHVDPILKLTNGKEYSQGGIPLVEESEPLDTAYIGGSLVHDHLKNFGLDIIAVMNNNLAMKTTIEDNSTFYGTVYASGTANFTGPFEKLKLKVDATTEAKTNFNLPVGGPLEVMETNYISFVDKNKMVDSSAIKSIKEQILSGLDIEIIAHIQPSAVARLIIDEKAGDIIEGSGKSDLRIHYSPTGELKMFGAFEITQGNYLFTYKMFGNNLINKPFKVKPGGTIIWGENDGDPYKAQLDIEAVYQKGLGVTNLVQSYTAGNLELSNLANIPCAVDLSMGLRGDLFSPEIDFDIKVSDVNSRLQNPVSLALRTIRSDKNELNRQVFGIIALQQFLPLENNPDIGNSAINTGISTVSELVSQQLTLYINDLLKGVIKDVGVISSLEFDFNFNVRDNDNLTINSRTSNVRLGGDVKFLDDKLTIYAGANLDIAGEEQTLTKVDANTNYLGADFRVEYALTAEGQLKIKAYNRTESTILGRSTRTGIGLSFKKEFNNLQDLVDETKKNKYARKKERLERKIKKLKTKIDNLKKQIALISDGKKRSRLIAKFDTLTKEHELLVQKLNLHKKEDNYNI
ncbi:translocation/assembly module TamB domain-containing protein [Aureispira]|nr:translocation/assembly module TamB domain-containing protein [Aureispira sp.]